MSTKFVQAGYEVIGNNARALFTLKLHRGDGMVLIAMNWKKGRPPRDFVGFAIEYREPNSTKFFPVLNRIAFPGPGGKVNPARLSSRLSPFQKFRWVHFPWHADLKGAFTYRVTPVFMDTREQLTYGDPQDADIVLARVTHPGTVNVTFTRGFIASQAFVDHFQQGKRMSTLVPPNKNQGLNFKPTHPKAKEALQWMGFEARQSILDLLDEAHADKSAEVKMVAYDFNLPDVLERLLKVAKRLQLIVDDDPKEHGKKNSQESQAAAKLKKAGATVKRQHMGKIQHNKTIVVNGKTCKAVICGSTNFSWRGFYIQNNNVLVLRGPKPVGIFSKAFDQYWEAARAKDFSTNTSASRWMDLGLTGVDAAATFSPHTSKNAMLDQIAKDVEKGAKSSVLYSLAFLGQTTGSIRDAMTKITKSKKLFVYGMADCQVKGMPALQLRRSGGNLPPVYPESLVRNLPEPFKREPTGLAGESETGRGTRMHHKFIVVDFNLASARVYLGSYNFSNPADRQNGENLLRIKDRRIATSYMIEALRIFDHYHFRIVQQKAKQQNRKLQLAKPPRKPGEKTWFDEDFDNPQKSRDRQLFA